MRMAHAQCSIVWFVDKKIMATMIRQRCVAGSATLCCRTMADHRNQDYPPDQHSAGLPSSSSCRSNKKPPPPPKNLVRHVFLLPFRLLARDGVDGGNQLQLFLRYFLFGGLNLAARSGEPSFEVLAILVERANLVAAVLQRIRFPRHAGAGSVRLRQHRRCSSARFVAGALEELKRATEVERTGIVVNFPFRCGC